ncbi:hypothetical protein D3C72_2436270 [compost metagenome]
MYSVLWPSCVQYSILSATAERAPLGRLSITVRIGSTGAGAGAAEALASVAALPVSSTEPRMLLGR